MGLHAFPKEKRILTRRGFVNLNRSGSRLHTKHFVLIWNQNGLGTARLGITVSKRIGCAVERNRLKRLIREFFRLNPARFPPGYDLLVAAKMDAGSLNLRQIEGEIGRILSGERSAV